MPRNDGEINIYENIQMKLIWIRNYLNKPWNKFIIRVIEIFVLARAQRKRKREGGRGEKERPILVFDQKFEKISENIQNCGFKVFGVK